MAEDFDLRPELEESGAFLSGHFILSSGRHSPHYVQCARLLELPSRARRVGGALAERLRPHTPDSILSPAMGGLLIGHETAAALDVPFRFSERGHQKAGEMEIRRGFALPPGERVAIVEDVVTTGKSTLETAALVEAAGATLVAVGAIIDRTGGSNPFPVPFEVLTGIDFDTYAPEECPRCAAGSEAVRPGSRVS